MPTVSIPCPRPLFDTLDHLQSSVNAQRIARQHHAEFELTLRFLFSYRGSEATFNAYRRELERFLQWCWQVEKISVFKVKREQIEDFVQFCQHPPLSWRGLKQVPRFVLQCGQRVANTEWRPFVVRRSKAQSSTQQTLTRKDFSLSQKAIQAVFAVLSSFYQYCIQEEAMAYNPVSQIRQKSRFIRKTQAAPVVRRLTELQWSYVIETATTMASQDSLHERTLFIMNALYGMYLRISELAASARWQPQMGHFNRDHDHNWWFKTVGKGNKERMISVSDAMLNALKRYRLALGLSALPPPGDNTPLIMASRGNQPLSSTRQIRNIVQRCFDTAIDKMNQDGFQEEVESLKAATVHWLRHTGISDDVKHRPREHVRDDAGHGSSAITDHYIDVEHRARHASAKKKIIDPNKSS